LIPIIFYVGGFAPVGGVESFTSDLVLGLRAYGVRSAIVCWGGEHSGIQGLRAQGVPVHRSPWRWGCRWRLPDLVLLVVHGWRTRRAKTITFTKMLGPRIHRMLRRLNPRARFVLVTAYRPAEEWKDAAKSEASGLLSAFDQVIVQAPSFEKDLRRIGYLGEVDVVPYLPPVPYATDLPSLDILRVGFLGRLAEQKNLPYLLSAVGEMSNGRAGSRRPIELRLIGEGPDRGKLAERAREVCPEVNVCFVGHVPREKVNEAIDGCHLFAFSSTTEGQCLAALEILSRGRPIVATPVGAFPDISARTSSGSLALAPLGDVKAFAAALGRAEAGIESGAITPEGVAREFGNAFPRATVLSHYEQMLTRGARRTR